jgi:WD40 repeat protein/energy-coupling factor transporter ATP-binding protein EcfA2
MVTESPFSSIVALRERHLELLKRHRERSDDSALLDADEAFVQSACLTGLLLDREADRDEAQRIVDTWATRLYRSGREVDESTLCEFDETLSPPPTGRPYVGFDAFSESDRKFFCGRDALVAELLERLKTSNLIALVGPSGSGKSSLMLAGVAPALKGGALPGSEAWLQSGRIVPGSDPLRHLAAALALAGGRDRCWEDEQIGLMRQNPNRLSDLLASLSPAGSVLLIDQFEEVFTLCQSEPDRQAFDANLATVVQSSSNHIVLLTMRDDYLGFLRQVPLMQPLINKAVRVPGTLTKEELEDAIQRPAEMVGLRFEDGVVDALVEDLKNVASALPLLQFTLLQLWDRRSRNRVTMSAYREIGGGKLGLARVADEFFEKSLSNQEQEIVKRIFMWLVKPGQGMVDFVSSRVRRNDLYQIAAPQIVDPILDKLVAARLIKLTSPESVADAGVEVAHEALIRNWGLLGEWLSKAREELSMKQRLELRASDWVRQSRKAGLLDELSLREFQQWLATPEAQLLGCSTSAKDLIAASQREVQRTFRRERRIRWAWGFGCVGGVLLAAIALFFARFAYDKRNAAERFAASSHKYASYSDYNFRQAQDENKKLQNAYRQLKLQEDDLLAKNKENLRLVNRYWATVFSDAAKSKSDTNPDVSALLALYANSFTWDTERRVLDPVLVALRNAIAGIRTEMVLRLDRPDRQSYPDTIAPVAFSPDGDMLAAADSEGSVHVWDAYTGVAMAPLQGPRKVGALTFCMSGKCLGAATPAGAYIWSLDTKRVNVLAKGKSVTSLAFSPDGKYIATGEEGQLRLWDPQGREGWKKDKIGVVSAVAFAPDATLVAAGSEDGYVRIWQTASGAVVAEKRLNAPRALAANRSPAQAGTAPAPPVPPSSKGPGEAARVTVLQFTRDGYLAAGGSQGLRARWRLPDFADDAARPSFDDRLLYSDGASTGAVLAINRDSGFLRSQQSWALSSSGWLYPSAARLVGHTAAVLNATFSPSGNRIATSSADGTIRIWTNRNLSSSSPGSWEIQESPDAADFSPDGNYLAVLDAPDVALYDTRNRRTVSTFSGRDKTAIALSADGRKVALAGAGVSLAVPGNPSRNINLDPAGRYDSVALSADGGKVVAGSSKTLRYWDTSNGRAASWDVPAHIVAISNGDGRWIAAGGDDGTVSLVDPGRRDVRTLEGHQGRVLCLAFDPRGRWLASGGNDKSIRLWSLSGNQSKSLLGSSEVIEKIAFSGDGSQLAAVTALGTVSLWDASNWTLIRTISGGARFTDTVAVAFARQGSSLLTIDNAGSVNRLLMAGDDVIEEAFNKLVRSWSDADCEAYLQKPCPLAFRAISLIVKANGEIRNGNLTAARTSLADALEADPKLPLDPETYVLHLVDKLTAQIAIQRTADLSVATEMAAWAGDIPAATKYYGDAQKLQPGDPSSPAKRAAALAAWLVGEARGAMRNGRASPYRFVEAWAYVRRARELDPRNTEFDATDLNEVCWFGSLNHFAADVKGACEEAGASVPTNFQSVDSRGLNRALLGDQRGAIQDFEYFVKMTPDPKAKAQRARYIELLRQGKNPFDERELKNII